MSLYCKAKHLFGINIPADKSGSARIIAVERDFIQSRLFAVAVMTILRRNRRQFIDSDVFVFISDVKRRLADNPGIGGEVVVIGVKNHDGFGTVVKATGIEADDGSH